MDDPFVSIVVPAYNEAATIEEVLDYGRTVAEGKKITWRDGIRVAWRPRALPRGPLTA